MSVFRLSALSGCTREGQGAVQCGVQTLYTFERRYAKAIPLACGMQAGVQCGEDTGGGGEGTHGGGGQVLDPCSLIFNCNFQLSRDVVQLWLGFSNMLYCCNDVVWGEGDLCCCW